MSSVLVVDDNAVNRKLAAALLKRRGMQVDEADSGILALEMLQYNSYEIVLLDISMPVMDGKEVCCIIRNTPNLQRCGSLPIPRTPWNLNDKASWLLGLTIYWSSPLARKTCFAWCLIELRNCELKIRTQAKL